ncbi:MAG: ABC transporter substrate-binding protein [Chloroflexota bacterium]|nr:ABC transporter substrate-binding protein [Chloroflexota bacterium]
MKSEICWQNRRINRRRLVGSTAAAGLGITLFGAAGLRARAAQDEPYRIVLIQGVTGDNFYISMACGAQAAADELGATLEVQGPERFDATLQAPLLSAVVQSAPDAILIAPNDRTAMIGPIQEAIDAGIAVVTVDTSIESDIAIANIASDNVEGGRIAARALAELIGETGKVFVINVQPGVSTTDQRADGFFEELANYPDIVDLGQEYSNNDPTQAASLLSAKLQSDPDLAGVFGTNLFSAQGAAVAIEQAGLQGTIKVVSFDAGPTQVEQLESGTVDALIAQHPYDIGWTGVQLAVEYLNTEAPPAETAITTGYSIVTLETIDDPEISRYLYVADCSEIAVAEASPEADATPVS